MTRKMWGFVVLILIGCLGVGVAQNPSIDWMTRLAHVETTLYGGPNVSGGAQPLVSNIGSVTANVAPDTAAHYTLGTNAKPFSSLYVGGAATNNTRFTGTLTAARTATIPDLSFYVSPASGDARYCTVPVGAVAYGSFGTDTTPSATTTYLASIFIPRTVSLTGISQLNGTAVGTDKVAYALYGSAGGAALATTALAGTTTTGTDAFKDVAFTAPYTAVGPARYWIAYQVNGTTARLRTVAASTFVAVLTTTQTGGTFGTFTTLTSPTTFTADVGPIACVY